MDLPSSKLSTPSRRSSLPVSSCRPQLSSTDATDRPAPFIMSRHQSNGRTTGRRPSLVSDSLITRQNSSRRPSLISRMSLPNPDEETRTLKIRVLETIISLSDSLSVPLAKLGLLADVVLHVGIDSPPSGAGEQRTPSWIMNEPRLQAIHVGLISRLRGIFGYANVENFDPIGFIPAPIPQRPKGSILLVARSLPSVVNDPADDWAALYGPGTEFCLTDPSKLAEAMLREHGVPSLESERCFKRCRTLAEREQAQNSTKQNDPAGLLPTLEKEKAYLGIFAVRTALNGQKEVLVYDKGNSQRQVSCLSDLTEFQPYTP